MQTTRTLIHGLRLFSIAMLSALGMLCAILNPGDANAATKDVIVLSCPNAMHVADFVACVTIYNLHNGRTGLFVAVNPTVNKTSFVQSTGTWTLTCSPCLFGGGTLRAVNNDGTTMTTDAQLTTLDEFLLAQQRNAGPITKPIRIDPNYGVSYINNDSILEDTPTAINQALASLGISTVPVNTIVTVVWQDGTSCQWKRVSNSTYTWAPIPGTAKDANGKPINPNGTLTYNPNAGSGAGIGQMSPTVTSSAGYSWGITIVGHGSCTYTVSVTTVDAGTVTDTGFGPCP